MSRSRIRYALSLGVLLLCSFTIPFSTARQEFAVRDVTLPHLEQEDQFEMDQGGKHLHRMRKHMSSVMFVSAMNIVINSLRPDRHITLAMAFPRICWESCIFVVAKCCKTGSSAFLLLLSLMTASTALIDIFLWGPLFATFTSFETCSGGWFDAKTCVSDYSNGLGRLVAVLQSMFGGFFYLLTAVLAWQAHWAIQQEGKVETQMRMMHQLVEASQSKGGNPKRVTS